MSTFARIREHLAKAAQTHNAAEKAAYYEAATSLIEAEYSHDETRKALYNALQANRTTPDGSTIYRWIRAVYDTFLVYEEGFGADEKLYKADYSIATDGKATISNPVEVRVEYVPVATNAELSESGTELQEGFSSKSFKPLLERAVRADGTMQIKIISPGEGSSGYYSREVIERDIPSVFPRGTHMMANHQTAEEEAARPEGEIENLAAVFVSDPYYLEESAAPDGEGAYVDVKPFADYAPMLEDKAESIGVSINGGGEVSIGNVNGKAMPIIERITVGKSVDFVTKAGRDGKIISLKEARRDRNGQPGGTLPPEPPITPPGDHEVNEQDTLKLTEAENRATAAENENKRLKEALVINEATKFVGEVLKDMDLNDLTRERLTESLGKRPLLKDGALDRDGFRTKIEEAAAAEIAYLQKVAGIGDGKPRNLGGSTTPEDAVILESVVNTRAQIGLS